MVCHSLLQWTTFCQTSPPWPAHLGWPHKAWLIFIELNKAVVLVWLDWLVFCEYGFNVSALWCPLATPTVLLGFLLPWTWGISSWLEENNRMGKTRDLFKKIRDTKGTFHAKMASIKDRNGMDLTEAEDIKKRWQNTQKNCTKKIFMTKIITMVWSLT